MCVQPVLSDPAQYYVQGWEGLFNTIGATTITKFITLESHRPLYYYIDDFEVTLNTTHLKSCLDIRYSNIAFILYSLYSGSTLYTELIVIDTCKSIMHVWHAGL